MVALARHLAGPYPTGQDTGAAGYRDWVFVWVWVFDWFWVFVWVWTGLCDRDRAGWLMPSAASEVCGCLR